MPDNLVDLDGFRALRALIKTVESFTATDPSTVAANVPARNRASTARHLRDLGTYFARIAWQLEPHGGKDQ